MGLSASHAEGIQSNNVRAKNGKGSFNNPAYFYKISRRVKSTYDVGSPEGEEMVLIQTKCPTASASFFARK